MADEQINTEEYRVQKEENNSYDPPPLVELPLKDSRGPIDERLKRILIVIGLIITIFLAYNFFNWYSERGLKTQAKKEMVASVASLPRIATVVPVAPKVEVGDAVHKQLQVLSQEMESNREQIAELSSSFMQMQKTMDSLNKNIALLSTTVGDFGAKMQQISDNSPKATKKTKVFPKRKNKLPLYHVKAIIPERVWLESDSGETVSLKVGDNLSGYGVVQAIDPKEGIVTTSSAVIRYGENDS